MLGAFDAPVAHLAFDDPWVGAKSTRAESLGEDLGDRVLMSGVDRQGGKIPAGFGCCAARPERCG
jgi:hypothetical protein